MESVNIKGRIWQVYTNKPPLKPQKVMEELLDARGHGREMSKTR